MTVQLNAIEARESTIGHIFSDEYAFEIPPYQRPYAWEQEQVEELLSDLLDAMDNGADGSVYFLGSIVLIKPPNQPQAKVVDGQQRLTTLTMMLSVLRDLTTDAEVKIVRRLSKSKSGQRRARSLSIITQTARSDFLPEVHPESRRNKNSSQSQHP